MTQPPRRVVFLDLARIQMPVGALTSILHRITGVLLALVIPVVALLLARSLQGPESYADVTRLFGHPVVKVVAILWIWALAHHLLAGLRHMLMDVDVGSLLKPARRSAWTVNIAGVVIALFTAGALW
ncbi:MAG: succinate dehydrogenase, cytochrome b556 subunit [Casimicrobiaceae bacterium]